MVLGLWRDPLTVHVLLAVGRLDNVGQKQMLPLSSSDSPGHILPGYFPFLPETSFPSRPRLRKLCFWDTIHLCSLGLINQHLLGSCYGVALLYIYVGVQL